MRLVTPLLLALSLIVTALPWVSYAQATPCATQALQAKSAHVMAGQGIANGADLVELLVSPDGSWIVLVRPKDHPNFAFMPAMGGGWHVTGAPGTPS